MNDYLLYHLKAAACLAVFYLFFKALLSREPLHRFNRLLLLAGIAASFVLPVWVVTFYRELPFAAHAVAESAAVPLENAGHDSGLLDWTLSGLCWIGLAGTVVALLRWSRSLGRTVRTIRCGRREGLAEGGVLVRVRGNVAPFSWMRYIVVSEHDLAGDGRYILLHEQAHRRFAHSWDRLFVDLLCCLQWFNPAMWLLRRELLRVHEYEADAAVLAAGSDPRAYQLLLIRKTVGDGRFAAASSFNRNQLKNRIDMMLREKSPRLAWTRALLLLPLLGVAVGAFARTVYRAPEPMERSRQTVVADGDTIVVEGVATKPLILVDGVKTESLDELDAAGIESISVFKGKSAVAKYGEQGANGVIVVTRKRGSDAAPNRLTVRIEDGKPVAETPERGKDEGDSQIRVTGVTSVSRAAGIDSAMRQTCVVVTGVPEQGISETQTTVVTVKGADAAVRSAAAREASVESEPAWRKGVKETRAAHAALEEAHEALERNRNASQEALEASREALKSSRRALEKARAEARKARKGEPDYNASVMLGGPEGSVRIGGAIDAEGRLILIDGVRATPKEMKRTLRKEVRQIHIWTGDDAVRKFGDEGRNGAIEIVTLP